ncbi:hypothetical protein MBAV_001557 [Candidatus Magnetobacterium bavaricum]|uniref:Uncharacterized protein n=1 Tax=Candidatus Magnetobacterium bavaricum TaxID=29290 RepID=A0A0F3GWH7_9BACT|nr:hypothetical protein MBAV_001557 [Candidatus Magnetobacterium bavaricum]
MQVLNNDVESMIAVELVFKDLFNQPLCVEYVFDIVKRCARDKDRAVNCRNQFGDLHGMSLRGNGLSTWTGSCSLVKERCRGHLSACHAVGGIVYKEHRQVFTPVGGVYDFGHPYGCQVAIPLVGKHYRLRVDSLERRGYGRGSSVCTLYYVKVKVVIGKHGTTHRRYSDHPVADTELIYALCYHPVQEAVPASRTKSKRHAAQTLRSLKYLLHLYVYSVYIIAHIAITIKCLFREKCKSIVNSSVH